MTIRHQTRREILKATAVLTATASVGGIIRRAAAQGGAAQSRQIDAVLRRATDAKEVPGVVAVAANDKGVIYEGAFGTRNLAQGPAMTLDTIFRLASMTKAVTSVAAMQLVEQGRLQLDQPIGSVLPELSAPQVLEGFDDAGAPRLRPAKRPITLRHLLTHTAGFGYEFDNADLVRYVKATSTPPASTGKLAALRLPLTFDPGERWQYGINIDWAGRAIEAVTGLPLEVYFRQHIFAPLGMSDTDYVISATQRSRLVSVHQRKEDGTLEPTEPKDPPWREFWGGGGGLYSTGRDYLVFLQMLMHEGRFNGAQLLRPQTVALMGQNQIGEIRAGLWKTTNPQLTNDLDLFPGIPCKWGLGYMINTLPGPNGRSAGSLTWGGIFNTYYWLDPQKRIAGVFLAQVLPFADHKAVALYGEFESGIYGGLKAA
ncbi:MAG TPA: serine hydrolase domain-containing protein [Stellaceae bacterium]|nr:serine hydrolase domain-containing protein [Stellaceae bacterium]